MPNIGTVTISDVENEMIGMLHGTTLSQIQNIYGVFNRAARRVVGLVDPQETKVLAQFGSVFQGVFDYPCPVDLKGNRVIDFYPQANRQVTDNYGQQYNKDFDLWKNYTDYTSFTPRYNSGVRTLRINSVNLIPGVQINDAAATNDNGLWVAGTNLSNLQTSSQFFTDGVSSSVAFTLNQTGVSTTASLSNSTMTAQNLTQNYFDNDNEFFWIYFPNASVITSIDYRLGSSATAYYDSGAITTNALGVAFQNGWTLIQIPFPNFTIHNSPNNAAINYINLSITYNGTLQNGVCINQFYSRTPTLFMLNYYSKYLFRDATTGAFKEKVTNVSDYVNLDTDGLNMFVWASFAAAVQQQQGLDAMFADGPDAETNFQAELAQYKSKYKGEVTKPRSSYYPNRQTSYRKYFGYGRLPPS